MITGTPRKALAATVPTAGMCMRRSRVVHPSVT